MPDLDTSWPHGSQDPIGQAAEFLVWAPLITQSSGGLHVFLPLLDRGLDAVVHRLADGAYLALQVKGKTTLHGPEAVIQVYEKHLFTPDQIVIGVHLDGDGLGPFALVADAATFKKKATRMVDARGRAMLVADMPIRPSPGHKWSEDLVPVNQLAARLGSGAHAPALTLRAEVSDEDRVTGFWGELEVCRQLAMIQECGLFRPFPDNETNEILFRRLVTGKTLGIQVKTGQLAEPSSRLTIEVNKSNFVPAPTTFIVVLGWRVPEQVFHETCLVIPSEAISSVATELGALYEFHFRPTGSDRPNRIDRYRVPLESLGEHFARQVSRDQTRMTLRPGTPS